MEHAIILPNGERFTVFSKNKTKPNKTKQNQTKKQKEEKCLVLVGSIGASLARPTVTQNHASF